MMELNQKLTKSMSRRCCIYTRKKYHGKNLEVKERVGVCSDITVLIVCPDSTLSQEKGCGDFLGCAVNSEEANSLPCKLAVKSM